MPSERSYALSLGGEQYSERIADALVIERCLERGVGNFAFESLLAHPGVTLRRATACGAVRAPKKRYGTISAKCRVFSGKCRVGVWFFGGTRHQFYK